MMTSVTGLASGSTPSMLDLKARPPSPPKSMSPSSAPAPRALQSSGLSLIVLEARERVGGRAHTIMASPDVTFDLGCGWLHSADRNSFVKIAEQLNFEIDKTRPPWREQAFNKAFPSDERADFIRALDAFYDQAEAAANQPTKTGPD